MSYTKSYTPELPTQSHGYGKTGFGKLGHGSPTWAHATSKPFGDQFNPIRPEVGRVRQSFQPITSIAALRRQANKIAAMEGPKHDAKTVVVPSSSGKCEVAAAIKSCEDGIKAAEARLAAQTKVQLALHQLKQGGVVKEYA